MVKLFRKTPLKQGILQVYVRAEFCNEKVVCLHTKTCWNSLWAMLNRLLEINSTISKALIDIKQQNVLDNRKFETLTVIVADLKPVKNSLQKLCGRNETLLTVGGVFASVIRELNQENSDFFENLKCYLVRKFNERWNVS